MISRLESGPRKVAYWDFGGTSGEDVGVSTQQPLQPVLNEDLSKVLGIIGISSSGELTMTQQLDLINISLKKDDNSVVQLPHANPNPEYKCYQNIPHAMLKLESKNYINRIATGRPYNQRKSFQEWAVKMYQLDKVYPILYTLENFRSASLFKLTPHLIDRARGNNTIGFENSYDVANLGSRFGIPYCVVVPQEEAYKQSQDSDLPLLVQNKSKAKMFWLHDEYGGNIERVIEDMTEYAQYTPLSPITSSASIAV